MSKRERACLEMRNGGAQGQAEETYCRHYIKKRRGYMTFLFFKLQAVGMFLFCAVLSVAAVFIKPFDTDSAILGVLPIVLAAISGSCWLCIIIKGLWYWKYTRHVFVTNDGIWVMSCSAFWWKSAPDFAGKRRLLAPSWSLYSWGELKSVSAALPKRKSVSKLIDFFEGFDNGVIKLTKLPSIYLSRWDGVERIDFLSPSDAEELLDYSKTRKPSRKKNT